MRARPGAIVRGAAVLVAAMATSGWPPPLTPPLAAQASTAQTARPATVAATADPALLKDAVLGTVRIFRPAGAPRGVVLLLSDLTGWTAEATSTAVTLRSAGALVAGIDTAILAAGLREAGGCAYPPGPLEAFAKRLELGEALPDYQHPVLAGVGVGASLVQATLAAAPPDAFSGGLSVGFQPRVSLGMPLCQIRALALDSRGPAHETRLRPVPLPAPWVVVGDPSADVGAWRETPRAATVAAAWERLRPRAQPGTGTAGQPTPAGVADLHLTEVPAAGTGDTFAVFLSGDGGWADLDRTVSARLAAAGMPVVGWSSLDYYWRPRTPEGAAADLARVITHYAAQWRKTRVVVIGYSFGADVAPFLVNRLPPALNARVRRVVLVGPSPTATFEFHLTDWVRTRPANDHPLPPEVAALHLPVTCVHPVDEVHPVCEAMPGATRQAVGRGHHFSEDYARLAAIALTP